VGKGRIPPWGWELEEFSFICYTDKTMNPPAVQREKERVTERSLNSSFLKTNLTQGYKKALGFLF